MRLTPRGKLGVLFMIQARTTSTATDGSITESWSDSHEIFGSVETRGGADKGPANDRMIGMERRVVVGDYDEDFSWSIKTHRLKHGATVLNITGVSDPNLLHWKIELTVEELVT